MKTFKQFNEARLSAAQRRALPDKDFALPGKGEGPKGKQAGSYPIPDEKHARSALSLVSQHGTPEEKAKVRAKVAKKFPGIKQESVEQIDEVQITKLGDAQHKAMVDAILKKRELEAVKKKKEATKKEEVQIDERLGGKGFSRKAAGSGIHKTSGDWPDSDRGAGNKATRRAGGNVEKKSPSYLAHVHNKAKYDNTKSPDYEKKKKALAKKHGGEENIKGHPQYEDTAFDNVVNALRKKHGEGSVITKDSPKPKVKPKAKPQPQKPLSAKEKAQREVDARYGRTPWNKKGSLGT